MEVHAEMGHGLKTRLDQIRAGKTCPQQCTVPSPNPKPSEPVVVKQEGSSLHLGQTIKDKC